MSRKRDNPIPNSNIYHECLTKLIRACSELQDGCINCPVKEPCKTWWYIYCSKITAENFPYLVSQFMSFREKTREKSRNYQKEVVNAKH